MITFISLLMFWLAFSYGFSVRHFSKDAQDGKETYFAVSFGILAYGVLSFLIQHFYK
jgi:hypothetical protein